MVALAAEVVSVVWVSSRTRQSAANDSEDKALKKKREEEEEEASRKPTRQSRGVK